MNTFTMELTCPGCNKQIRIVQTARTPSLQGKCPECGCMIGWKPEDMICTSFKPQNAAEEEIAEVLIRREHDL